jgi:hypothetical protein
VEQPERLVTREDLNAMAAGSLLSVAVATVLGLAIPPTFTVQRFVAECYEPNCPPEPDSRLIFVLLGFFLGSFVLGWWAWRKVVERPTQPRPSRPLLGNWREFAAYAAVWFTTYLVLNALIRAISDRVRVVGGYYSADGSPVDVFVVAPASVAFLYVLVVALAWPAFGVAGYLLGVVRRRLRSPAVRAADATNAASDNPGLT